MLAMQATVHWNGKVRFTGVAGSGHAVAIDGPPEMGGENAGVRPMELMLLGLGGCTAFDVVNILRKGRQRVLDCRAEISAERADEEPKVFTRIHVHFVVVGEGVDERRVQRAIDLTAQKYCSASIMLERGGVAISHDFEVQEPAADRVARAPEPKNPLATPEAEGS